MNPLCLIQDHECVQGRLKCGLCEKHYRRQRATGSTASPFIDNWTRYAIDGNGCWIWQGPIYWNGYGQLSRRLFGTQLAHRAFYIKKHGPVVKKIDLDHLCRVRSCVNPAHLEPVTRSVNLRRGAGSHGRIKLTCQKGLHDTTLPGALRESAPGCVECKECWRIRYRAAGQRYRDRLKAESGSIRPRHRESPDHTDSPRRSQQNPMGPRGTSTVPPPPGRA